MMKIKIKFKTSELINGGQIFLIVLVLVTFIEHVTGLFLGWLDEWFYYYWLHFLFCYYFSFDMIIIVSSTNKKYNSFVLFKKILK